MNTPKSTRRGFLARLLAACGLAAFCKPKAVSSEPKLIWDKRRYTSYWVAAFDHEVHWEAEQTGSWPLMPATEMPGLILAESDVKICRVVNRDFQPVYKIQGRYKYIRIYRKDASCRPSQESM